jgi:hypothetical protein
MKHNYLPAEFAPLMLILSGCHPDAVNDAERIDGTVRLLNVEGGCWIIDTNEGRVQPLDLPAEFRREGLAVVVTLSDVKDVVTSCQAGVLKHIETIEERK